MRDGVEEAIEPAAWRMLAFLDWLWGAYARDGRRFGVEWGALLEQYEGLAEANAGNLRVAHDWRIQATTCRLMLGLFAGARASFVYQPGGRP